MRLAIIPARGGSKGIPRKNLKLLVGKPLVAHSIVQAKQTPGITRVVVSTDDAEIAAVSREWGAEVVHRPPEISGDTASSESAILHVLDWLQTTEHYQPEFVVFLQATSPMRAPDDIQRAIETLEREHADSLFSACRVEGFAWRLARGAVAPVNYDPTRRPLRQDLKEEIWEENGSFYIFKPWVLRKFISRLGGRIAMHKMQRAASFQIDEPGDFELLEHLMAFGRAEGGNLKAETRAEGGNLKPESGKQKAESGEANPISAFSFQTSAFKNVRLLALDFDGVMTDNRVLVTEEGKEAVLCDRSDSLGLERLKKAGVEVLVISKEKNPVVSARCRKLGIECIQGCDNKLAALKGRAEGRNRKPETRAEGGNLKAETRAEGGNLKPESGKQKAESGTSPSQVSGFIPHPSPGLLKPEEIAYVGNDINDFECLRWVGLPIAVADAVPEVLAVAKMITSKPGGHGAVREVCEAILKAER